MRRLLFATVLALAAAAEGSWTRFGLVEVADRAGFSEAADKFSTDTGNMMLGLLVRGLLVKLPGVELFGDARQGVPSAYVLLADGRRSVAAFLYPVKGGKAAFMTRHPALKETDGVFEVREDDERRYVVFSADGLWAACAGRRDAAALALSATGLVGTRLGAKLVNFDLDPQAAPEVFGEYGDFRRVSRVTGAVQLGDRGLDLRAVLKGAAGAGASAAPLGERPLAFAAGDSLVAWASSGAGNAAVESVTNALGELRREFAGKGMPLRFDVNGGRGAVRLDGYRAARTPEQLGAKMFPEYARVPPNAVAAGSLYGLVRAFGAVYLADGMPAERAKLLKSVFARLPDGGAGGTGFVSWCQGDSIFAVLRVSTAELADIAKALPAVFAAGLM